MTLLPKIRVKYLNQVSTTVTVKEDTFDNIVTDIDLKIQEELTSTLSARFPEVTFLAEENDLQEFSDKMWIIDPIDGTKNFFRRNEDFALSIAYYENQQPVFGFVYDIAKDLLYLGIRGQGAWVNQKKMDHVKIRTLHESVLDMNLKTTFTLGLKNPGCVEKLSHEVFAHRSIGSAAISLCRIAAGSHEIYISSHLKLWDFAAAQIVLEEVGGIVVLPYEPNRQIAGKSVMLVGCSSPFLYKDLEKILFIGELELS
jgi:myo-inositol-1(or 4)-monophosphatase